MKPTLIRSIARSAWFSRKEAIVQLLMVALLSALISGSLLTGYSVKLSLAKQMEERLGGTDFIISSGIRYFDPALAGRLSDRTGNKVIAVVESEGFCQNFSTQETALNCSVYGINSDFFPFNGSEKINIKPGEAVINEALANKIGLKAGDEMIIHFRQSNPIPVNAPFSPSGEISNSLVVKISKIVGKDESGDFSTKISQGTPLNIFLSAEGFNSVESGNSSGKTGANRLFIRCSTKCDINEIKKSLRDVLELSDIGLLLRVSEKRNETELISDRIFIDSQLVASVVKRIPQAMPVLTYLANSLEYNGRNTPYSFVSAVPSTMMPGLADKGIIINKWLSKDLNAIEGDTITMSWFVPAKNNLLKVSSGKFTIRKVIENSDPISDPALMPDFPGISGRTTCSGWDAGIPLDLKSIRHKDEEYWNLYRGTPKAFINYNTGREIWGNNFGIATSVRFPGAITPDSVKSLMKSALDPLTTGFTVSDARESSGKAASESVDFGTLFLGLGIFIIVSCLILLAISQANFFERKKKQVRSYFVLGFTNGMIRRTLFLETMFIGLAGALPGAFAGTLLNSIIIGALNSAWQGAVGTNTLASAANLAPILEGFLSAIIISLVITLVQLNRFLKKLSEPETGKIHIPSFRRNLISAILVTVSAICLLAISLLWRNSSEALTFASGALLFAGMILFQRTYYISRSVLTLKKHDINFSPSRYSSLHPGHATTPAIFIAAGLFAVIITAANKQDISKNDLKVSGGTGGYLLWAESALPVRADLMSTEGRKEFGLDEPGLSDIKIRQGAVLRADDASCLNLNHVSTPSLLAFDPSEFIERGSFSFSSSIKKNRGENPWKMLDEMAGPNTIFGMADQSVLEWGLKVGIGDTIKYRSENGEVLNIIICAGLRSSVFQGYLLIGRRNLEKYFPSVPGNSVFLVDGKKGQEAEYINALTGRFSGYGLAISGTGEKLSSFFTVSNTYLEVFTLLGIFGMILGIAGLGFILILNFKRRKKEFAVMIATGYAISQIRMILLFEYSIILLWGIVSGVIPALVATSGSLIQRGTLPLGQFMIMVGAIILVGGAALYISTTRIQGESLITELRKE